MSALLRRLSGFVRRGERVERMLLDIDLSAQIAQPGDGVTKRSSHGDGCCADDSDGDVTHLT